MQGESSVRSPVRPPNRDFAAERQRRHCKHFFKISVPLVLSLAVWAISVLSEVTDRLYCEQALGGILAC
jgi:hypothetical protein